MPTRQTAVLDYWNAKTSHIAGLNDQLDRMQEIGMCGSPQPEYLFKLSNSLTGKGGVVEIGTCSGISLIALALGQKLKKGVPVTSIDIQEHADLERNLVAAGVKDYATCITDDASHVAMQWHEPVELLWIDGDHSYEGASKDILSWEQFVVKGGLLAMHDYGSATGVFRAIYKHILSCPCTWRVISDRELSSIVVAQKLGNDCRPWVNPTMWYRIKRRIRNKINFFRLPHGGDYNK